jgi:hypothetical protein
MYNSYRDALYDGGGNRNQTKINLVPSEPLRQYFDLDITTVIPGICSIIAGEDTHILPIHSPHPHQLFTTSSLLFAMLPM